MLSKSSPTRKATNTHSKGWEWEIDKKTTHMHTHTPNCLNLKVRNGAIGWNKMMTMMAMMMLMMMFYHNDIWHQSIQRNIRIIFVYGCSHFDLFAFWDGYFIIIFCSRVIFCMSYTHTSYEHMHCSIDMAYYSNIALHTQRMNNHKLQLVLSHIEWHIYKWWNVPWASRLQQYPHSVKVFFHPCGQITNTYILHRTQWSWCVCVFNASMLLYTHIFQFVYLFIYIHMNVCPMFHSYPIHICIGFNGI